MITTSQLRNQRAILTRICKQVAIEYAIAYLAGDSDTMEELVDEHHRLAVNIDVLGRWIEELRLSEQAAPVMREVQRILNHHL